MKRNSRTLIATAAIAGLLTGAAVTSLRAADSDSSAKPGKNAEGKKMPKPHDCSGQNDCKGLGGCKTEKNSCKFMNACKGQGGCHLTQKDIDKKFGKKSS